MSSPDFQQLLALAPTLTAEQLQLLRQQVDAISIDPGEGRTLSDSDEQLQLRLLAPGLVDEIKPPPRPTARPFIPTRISGEPLPETVIRERR